MALSPSQPPSVAAASKTKLAIAIACMHICVRALARHAYLYIRSYYVLRHLDFGMHLPCVFFRLCVIACAQLTRRGCGVCVISPSPVTYVCPT